MDRTTTRSVQLGEENSPTDSSALRNTPTLYAPSSPGSYVGLGTLMKFACISYSEKVLASDVLVA